MAAFNARLARVTGAAKGLQIAKLEGQFRVGSDWRDVIHFQTPGRGPVVRRCAHGRAATQVDTCYGRAFTGR